MNEIAPDVALTGECIVVGLLPTSNSPLGNHDFDFGSPTTVSMKLEAVLLTKHHYRISPFNEAPPSDKFRTYIHLIRPSRIVVLIVFSQPWLLSNIIDNTTSKVPEYLKEYEIFEREGVRIGIIGLVEKWTFSMKAANLSN